jgi:hypothetical protein
MKVHTADIRFSWKCLTLSKFSQRRYYLSCFTTHAKNKGTYPKNNRGRTTFFRYLRRSFDDFPLNSAPQVFTFDHKSRLEKVQIGAVAANTAADTVTYKSTPSASAFSKPPQAHKPPTLLH